MKSWFVGVFAALQGLIHNVSRPSIEYKPIPGANAPTPTQDECKVLFGNVLPDPARRPYEVIGEFTIPEGAYGDASDMAYTQFEDLIARLKPIACKNGGNRVFLINDPEQLGVRKAQLLYVHPKGNSEG